MPFVVRTPHPPPRPSAWRAGLRRRRRHDDDGGASIELVLAAPVLVLLLMLIVQFAVWAHATHIAQAAANEAAQAARLYQASAGQGDAAGTALLDQSAGTILADPTVTVTRTATTVTVTVTGTAATVVPGLQLPVRVSVTAPVERVRSISVPAFAHISEARP